MDVNASRINARQRVSLACAACRAKRSRCDGVRPACGPCTRKGIECLYQDGENKRKPPSKRYVESLQTRIKLLEDQLASLGQPVSSVYTNEIFTEDEEDEDSEDDNVAKVRDPVEEISAIAGRLNLGEDGQLRYFGSQSNYHLLRGSIDNVTSKSIEHCQRYGASIAMQLGKKVSISKELESHLLDLYWRWQNPWIYLIHKESFMQDYKSGTGKYCTPLLLSAIFALVSRYSDHPELQTAPDDPNPVGHAFAEQAKILLLYESEAASIATAQAAALLSLRWMSENKETMGWLYIGMATRIAHNLGLNLDTTPWLQSGLLTPEEAEVRKVAWWGLFTLDKLFCLGLGRPGLTRNQDITCPKPTSDSSSEFEAWTPCGDKDQGVLGSPSRITSTAQYQCEHLGIVSEALDELYAPRCKLSRKQIEEVIATTDVTLNAFYTGLPSHLRLPASRKTPALPHIYQLHIQYHVMQILLHRPLITSRHVGSKLSQHQLSEANIHLQTCRESASKVVSILAIYRHFYSLRMIPIVTVCNTFTAAVVHLMDAASVDDRVRHSAIRKLRICVQCLQDMAASWAWSSRALRAVQLLAQEWLIPDAVAKEREKGKVLDTKEKSDNPLRTDKLGDAVVDVNSGIIVPSSSALLSTTDPEPTHANFQGENPSIHRSEIVDDLSWLEEDPLLHGIYQGVNAHEPRQVDTWLYNSTRDPFTFMDWGQSTGELNTSAAWPISGLLDDQDYQQQDWW